MRQLRRSTDRIESPDSPFTWRTPGTVAGRLEVPVTGAWERLYANQRRREMLSTMFSQDVVAVGGVLGLAGPALTSKSQVALALADLRGLRAVYATDQTDQQAYKPAPGLCVIVDPVSAYDPHAVAACVAYYAATNPVILIDRDPQTVAAVPGVQRVMKLKLPAADAIADYLRGLLGDEHTGYRHQLTDSDFQQLGVALTGFSMPQVNQVAMDAALERLQNDQPIDRDAFDRAMAAMVTMRQSSQQAALPGQGGPR